VAHGLEAIDWEAPWLEPWRLPGEVLVQAIENSTDYPAELNGVSAVENPVRFVPQSELTAGWNYEQYIFEKGCVPTRDGVHDFFNALCWMRFPLTKARLNQLQVAQISKWGIREQRGAIRDALTLFDENAALLQAPDALWDALLEKDWEFLFVRQRSLWNEANLVLFGHALLEKLVHPRKAITAHVYRVTCASEHLVDWDGWLARTIQPEILASKPFANLPVLGVPGWWPLNSDPGFYSDESVFRSPRSRRAQNPTNSVLPLQSL